MYAGFLISGLLVAFEPATCLAQAAEEKPTAEIDDPKNPLIPEFRRCDVDKDGLLTEAEYQHRISFSQQDAHREFVIFDADGDAKITLNEFLTVPIGQAEEYRGTISDPVIVSARTKLKELTEFWPQSDQNADGLISGSEYSASNLASRVPGLEATPFADWDLNHNGGLSRDEVARVLDVAWGVCVPDGTMLRDKVGRVVDWTTYLNLKKDAKGVVTRNAYYQALGPAVPNPEDWFRGIDRNNDGSFDFVEFSTGSHRTDPVTTFLNLDVDLSGTLSRTELNAIDVGWRQMALLGMRAFDDNTNGELSLQEFQFMPHSNLVAAWSSARDTNNDGLLSPDEFQFRTGLPLAAITREYFQRLDLNDNQHLTLDEWHFHTDRPFP